MAGGERVWVHMHLCCTTEVFALSRHSLKLLEYTYLVHRIVFFMRILFNVERVKRERKENGKKRANDNGRTEGIDSMAIKKSGEVHR